MVLIVIITFLTGRAYGIRPVQVLRDDPMVDNVGNALNR